MAIRKRTSERDPLPKEKRCEERMCVCMCMCMNVCVCVCAKERTKEAVYLEEAIEDPGRSRPLTYTQAGCSRRRDAMHTCLRKR